MTFSKELGLQVSQSRNTLKVPIRSQYLLVHMKCSLELFDMYYHGLSVHWLFPAYLSSALNILWLSSYFLKLG